MIFDVRSYEPVISRRPALHAQGDIGCNIEHVLGVEKETGCSGRLGEIGKSFRSTALAVPIK